MTTFVTVIQTKANRFDVFKFNATTQKALYPQTSKVGITVAVFEATEQNEKYCFGLVEQMNNGE